jgi:non-heme chloroperoxidase
MAMTEQLRVNDVTFSVEAAGSGPPVVFIHGWSMSGRFFRRQVEGLSGRFRVVVPDLRGHGASEKADRGHTVPQYAADLHAILGELSVERPVLVGWSMGAMVGYEYLRAYGRGGVAGLVVVDQPPSDFAWEGYEFGVFTMEELRDMNEQLQLDQETVVDEFTRLMVHKPDEETLAWMAAEILRVPPVIASTILLDQTLRDYRDFLPRIDVPALVLFGEDDKLTSPRAGEYIAERIPGARLQTFAESSHCPFWEESEAFNDAVTAFVTGLPRP